MTKALELRASAGLHGLEPMPEAEIFELAYRKPLPARPQPAPITGRYVTLEPLHAGHAAELWPLAQEAPWTWRYLPAGPFANFRAFSVYVRLMMSSPDELVWCIRPHDAAGLPMAAAGWLALLDIQLAHAKIELGNIWFPPQLQRTRAATEAMALLLQEVFDRNAFHRVTWKCNPLNQASIAAAERLGFKFEGRLRENMIVKGSFRDSSYFSLLAESWPDRKAALTAWLRPENFNSDGQQIIKLRRSI